MRRRKEQTALRRRANYFSAKLTVSVLSYDVVRDEIFCVASSQFIAVRRRSCDATPQRSVVASPLGIAVHILA